MPSMKLIKRKISSVSNTQQIMKAMNLVAASKLQRAKAHLESARPMVEESKQLIENLKGRDDILENVFVRPRDIKTIAYIVITSDRGLCGGYNVNVAREVLSFMKKNDVGEGKIIAVGTKGWEYFRRRRKEIMRRFSGVSETANYADAAAIGGLVSSLFVAGEIDEVYVAYTQYKSTMSHVPVVQKLLPFDDGPPPRYMYYEMEYEPDANAFLNQAAQFYINAFIYGAMAESAACEQAARMVGMDSASNNAAEIIEDLSLMYNRMRQSSITQEINEIVSGTNALR